MPSQTCTVPLHLGGHPWKVRGHCKKNFSGALRRTCAPHFQIRSGATVWNSWKYLCSEDCCHGFVDMRKLRSRWQHACQRSLYKVARLTVGFCLPPNNLWKTSSRRAANATPSHNRACYRRGVIGEGIFNLRGCGFVQVSAGLRCENTRWLLTFFCSCDLDLNPMTFIYELDPYCVNS